MENVCAHLESSLIPKRAHNQDSAQLAISGLEFKSTQTGMAMNSIWADLTSQWIVFGRFAKPSQKPQNLKTFVQENNK